MKRNGKLYATETKMPQVNIPRKVLMLKLLNSDDHMWY